VTEKLHKYSLYGDVWETDFPFSYSLIPARSKALVRLRRGRDLPDPPDRDCIFATEVLDNGVAPLRLFMTQGGCLLRYAGLADLVISRHDIR
jgi:hypothetical protein